MSRFSNGRSPLSTLLSVIALFVALGGSAYAAARITGASVKDNSLSGKDIRDRSVRARDLRAGVLKPGPAGPAGPRGPQGAPGVSTAVHRVGPDTVLEGGNQTILTAPLPAGSWIVTATGLVDNDGDASVGRGAGCSIESGGALLADTGLMNLGRDVVGVPKTDAEQFSITGPLVRATQGSVAIVCDRAGGGGTEDVVVARPTLTAVQVGSINTENGD